MATVDCQRCGHGGRTYHYDGPCVALDCTCQRFIVPMSSARYQQLLDWLHEGKDITNINGDDLPSLLLSYEQVLDGVFAMRTEIAQLPYYTRRGLIRGVVDYRDDVVATMDTRLRKTFGMEEDKS